MLSSLLYVRTGSYGGGGACGDSCGAIFGGVFGTVGGILLLLIALGIARARRIAPHQRVVYDLQTKQNLDNKLLRLTPAGAPTTYQYTTAVTMSDSAAPSDCCPAAYSAPRDATIQLYFDNTSRALAGSGLDSNGPFDLVGHVTLDTPTHGYLALTKTYDAILTVRCAAEFSTADGGTVSALQGSWYSQRATSYRGQTRNVSNAGPWRMAFSQPLTIVDTQYGAGAPHVAVNVAADREPTAPLTPDSSQQQGPPPAYSEPYTGQSLSAAEGGGRQQADVEMVAPPRA